METDKIEEIPNTSVLQNRQDRSCPGRVREDDFDEIEVRLVRLNFYRKSK